MMIGVYQSVRRTKDGNQIRSEEVHAENRAEARRRLRCRPEEVTFVRHDRRTVEDSLCCVYRDTPISMLDQRVNQVERSFAGRAPWRSVR